MDSAFGTPATIPARSRIPGWWRAALASTLLVPVLVAGGLLYHTDDFALAPGPATDVSQLIRVDGDQRQSKGAFLITTVSVTFDTINVFEWIRAAIDPVIETVPRTALIGPGLSNQQQDERNQADMEQSKYAATVVAMRSSGLTVSPIPGVRVVKVFSGPASAVLKDGDVIVSINGRAVPDIPRLSQAVGARPVGSEITIGYLRGEERRTATIKTSADPENPTRPVIGIRPDEAFRLPVRVNIDSQSIVGPSGGLVFTLAIADALTPGDLTRGHRIAATGTIALDGSVGQIGGVEQKVRAAEYAGADIFLVPADEVDQARAAARSIKVYGVRTFADAIAVLDGLEERKAG